MPWKSPEKKKSQELGLPGRPRQPIIITVARATTPRYARNELIQSTKTTTHGQPASPPWPFPLLTTVTNPRNQLLLAASVLQGHGRNTETPCTVRYRPSLCSERLCS
jgi:hypothetical protein